MYDRATLLVASDISPANVRLPVLVKLVFSAPVPAYILDKASPFSAQSSRWDNHKGPEDTHSRRTLRR